MRACGRVVLLDGPVIGKCDRCRPQYYPADVAKLAERVATHPEEAASRTPGSYRARLSVVPVESP
jgi:hypothetical protein